MSNGNIHIFSVGSEHTTARYFASAIQIARGKAVTYWDRVVNPLALPAGETLLYVDPATAWPLGIEQAPGLTVAYLIDVHQDLESRLRIACLFDLIFIAQKDYLSAFQQVGHRNVHWLPLACDPTVHSAPAPERNVDVAFVGKAGARGSRRYEILTGVLPRFSTNDFHAWYSPTEMAKVYGRSKIVFNASINGDLNMRFFEALASGALLITDRIENGLKELFVEDVHYVGYSNLDEALEKINYYLRDDSQREKIAAEGQRLALAKHTYLNRWDQILRERDKAAMAAPARCYSTGDLARLYSEIFATLRQPTRILSVGHRYGLGPALVKNFFKSGARWLNSRLPLTPNAVRSKFTRPWN